MRIDDWFREMTLKTDPTLRGKVDLSTVGESELVTGLPEGIADNDFLFPDLLQAFGRMLSRRHSILESLPSEVKNRLPELFAQEGSGPLANLQQGIVSAVRDNRQSQEAIRQLIQEFELVERLPTQINQSTTKTILQANPTNGNENDTSRSGLAKPENLFSSALVSDNLRNEALLTTIFSRLEKAWITANEAKEASIAVFDQLLRQSVQDGRMPEKFAAWISQTASTLEETTAPAWLEALTKRWQSKMDPAVSQLARSLDKPELVKVWSIVRDWEASFYLTHNKSIAETGMQKFSSATDLLRQQFAEIELESLDSRYTSLLPVRHDIQSYTHRLESIFYRLFTAKPEVTLENLHQTQNILRAVYQGIAGADTRLVSSTKRPELFDLLAKLAPKWLTASIPKEEQTEILNLWVAAKQVDVSPWLKLGSPERHRILQLLRELASTFEQPEPFRLIRENADSRVFLTQLPLYAPGQERPYPAIIQVYEEKKDPLRKQELSQEIWVRVSLQTDNLGVVDLSFRLQDKRYLSIFSRFAEPTAAEAFRTLLADIRQDFLDGPLELKKIAVAGRIAGIGNNE